MKSINHCFLLQTVSISMLLRYSHHQIFVFIGEKIILLLLHRIFLHVIVELDCLLHKNLIAYEEYANPALNYFKY